MRSHSKRAAEDPDQVGRMRIQDRSRVLQADALDEPRVKQVTQAPREADIFHRGAQPDPPVQVVTQPFGYQRQAALCFQLVSGMLQHLMQLVHTQPQLGIVQSRAVHGQPHQFPGQLRGIQIQDTLTKTVRGEETAVVWDMRREQSDRVVHHIVLVATQVVPHNPVVNDQQRPGLVRVHRIDVVGDLGVKHLSHARNFRAPGSNPGTLRHAKIVQDTAAAARVGSETMETTNEPPRFDTKIAVAVRDDLQTWQRLNMTAFLVSGIGTTVPELIGEPYADADDTAYLPMFRQPVLVFESSKETLTTCHRRAVERELPLAVFTSDLFASNNDRDNRAAVRAVHRDQLDLVGMAVHGPRNAVDKVLKGTRMHA